MSTVPTESQTGEPFSAAKAAAAPQSAAATPPRPGQGRMVLLLIAGIPVTMILAASWLWFFVARGELDLVGALGTSNAGDLLKPPRQALEAGWTTASDTPLALPDTPRWTLVIPDADGDCDADCEYLLYETRQIHGLLGKDMGRLQRALVSTAAPDELALSTEALSDERPVPETFSAYVDRDQRGLNLWRSGAGSFDEMFPELKEQPGSWYLMDPYGWVMMRYDESVHFKDVLSDLKFLLKNSNG